MSQPHSRTHRNFPSLIAVFPGQGSQKVGMGKELFEHSSLANEIFEEASEAIHFDLKKICLEGPESELNLTENTQPCLLAVSVAAFRIAEKEFHFSPGAVAGHSLGEYSALVANGSISLTTSTRWVRERGIAMQKAVPPGEGSMAAILGLENQQIEKLCTLATEMSQAARSESSEFKSSVPACVEPANFNAPGQVVIAGSVDGIQKAIELLQSESDFKGGKAIPLTVSAPFHCSLMKPAADRMADLFAGTPSSEGPKNPFFPYVPNRTGRLTRESSLVLQLLIEQIDQPVLWNQSIQNLLHSGFCHLVEFGPGRVLCGLTKRIASSINKPCTLDSFGQPANLKDIENLLEKIMRSDVLNA